MLNLLFQLDLSVANVDLFAWYNKVHSLIVKPYLTIFANNAWIWNSLPFRPQKLASSTTAIKYTKPIDGTLTRKIAVQSSSKGQKFKVKPAETFGGQTASSEGNLLLNQSMPEECRNKGLLSQSFYPVRESVHTALSETVSLCDSQYI